MTQPPESQFPAVHIPEFDQADRMKKALRDARMSSTGMAEFLGITRETAGRYMSGAAKVPLQTLRLWALRTGVPLEWLRDGIVPEDVAQEPPAAKRKTSSRARKNRPLDYKPEPVTREPIPPDRPVYGFLTRSLPLTTRVSRTTPETATVGPHDAPIQ